MAIILGMLWRLGNKAITGAVFEVPALAVSAAFLLGLSEIPALLVGGLIGTVALSIVNRTGEVKRLARRPAHRGRR